MMAKLARCLHLLIVVIFATMHFRQEYSVAFFTFEQETDITEFISNAMDCRDNPGLTLAVVKNGETWTKGFGLANLDTNRHVTNSTLFGIGSLTKAFTAVLLGNILRDTNYTFETRLVDIPGVDVNFINSSMTEVATLADLLDHSTGLSSITDYGFIAGYPPQADRKFMTGKTKYVPEMQTPRTTMLYNNMMYMVLGHVIEVLGGDTWENLMSIRIFKPLRMTTARIIKTPEDVLREDVANPYIFKDGQFFNSDPDVYVLAPLEPAGCVFATGPEMALWMDFMLNNGTTSEGVTLLREEDLLAIRQKHINLPLSITVLNLMPPRFPVTDERDGYGFAWFTGHYRGHKRVSHSGGYFSYISLEWLFPDEKFGVFASVNGPALPSVSSQGLQAILSYVTDLGLDMVPWLNLTTGCTFPAPWRKPFTFQIDPPEILTNDHLEDFTGVYGNALLPDITLHVNTSHDKRQILWLEMNRLQGELFPTASNNSFTFKMVLPWEYAIERVFNENFTIQYPTDFFRDPIKGQVLGFNITLSGKNDVMTYRKCARFLNENACEETRSTTPDPISGCDCSTKCCFWFVLQSVLVALLVF